MTEATTNAEIRPSRPTKAQLAKVGVEIECPHTWRLCCTSCGQEWSPMIRRGGKQPRSYWKCPNGCNS
jgi:hypothetical protein